MPPQVNTFYNLVTGVHRAETHQCMLASWCHDESDRGTRACPFADKKHGPALRGRRSAPAGWRNRWLPVMPFADIYEWGWGSSFHFSPLLPGKSISASEAAHEARIAALLGIKPGQKALDVGCGVGGPMRTIASTSGAHVTGLTINDYQVSRAIHHNQTVSGLRERHPRHAIAPEPHFKPGMS